MEEALLDDIIRRLLESKSGKVPKQVQLNEAEIKQLCAAAKEVFLSQPNLLELEAPIKICGNLLFLLSCFRNVRLLFLVFFGFSCCFHLYMACLFLIDLYVHYFVIWNLFVYFVLVCFW